MRTKPILTVVLSLALSASFLDAEKTTAERVTRATIDGKNFFSVTDFGATGGGKTLDTAAINNAIDAAAAKGGGTVYFRAGTYLSFSIRLKRNITIYLDNGATIL